MTLLRPNRRHLLAGFGVLAMAVPAKAAGTLDALEFGVTSQSPEDQSAPLQQAMLAAQEQGLSLTLPAGTIFCEGLQFPSNVIIEGVPGSTALVGWQDTAIGKVSNASHLVLRNIGFGPAGAGGTGSAPLLEVEASSDIIFEQCRFANGGSVGLNLTASQATIRDCEFAGHPDAAIHSMDSRGLLITGNRISDCGNAGIRIWRSDSGPDGSIISENRISNIRAADGGNGANGNGINVFKADEVIVSDNHIADCAFTAVRLNTTNNSQVSGNTCLRSGETAIYSEFAFSGSVIANNIIDGAAIGISMTNYNEGGHVAVCTGNIVRNIAPRSLVNPDASPVGIYAEAEAAITGNTIHRVPGTGIAAGYGPYLSNVLVANNVLHDILVGIAISIAPGAGNAQVTGNMIFDPEHAVVGMAWDEMADRDLIANAGNYPQLTIANNTIGAVQGG